MARVERSGENQTDVKGYRSPIFRCEVTLVFLLDVNFNVTQYDVGIFVDVKSKK